MPSDLELRPYEALTPKYPKGRDKKFGPTNKLKGEDADEFPRTISRRLRRGGGGYVVRGVTGARSSADAAAGRGPQCRGGPERLADLSWHLQVLPLQRPRPDQYRQRQESRSCLDAFSGT